MKRICKYTLIILCAFWITKSSAQTKVLNSLLPITTIKYETDSVLVSVPVGKNMGVKINQSGGVLTKYYVGDEYESRNNQIIGTVTIRQVFDTFALGAFFYSSSVDTDSIQVFHNDLVSLDLQIPEDTYVGILAQLKSFNIDLSYPMDSESRADSKTRFYDWNTIVRIKNWEDEKKILNQMLKELKITGSLYNDSAAFPSFYERYESGRFDGYALIEMLTKSDLLDVVMFLEFVSDFPYKYIGYNFFLDETFATWGINKTPLPSKIEKPLQQFYSNTINERDDWGHPYYLLQIKDKKNWLDDFSLKDTLEDYNALIDLWKFQENDSLINDVRILKINYLNTDYKEILKVTDEIMSSNDRGVDNSMWWSRAAAQYMLKDYENAIISFDSANLLIEHSSVYAYRAWSRMFLGNWKDARDDIRKAYSLDTLHPFWSALMGNMFLLMNQKDSASFYYTKSLVNMGSQSEFKAVTDDFDVFLKRGWHEENSKYFKDFFATYYDTSHLRERLLSNDFFNQMLNIDDDYAQKLPLIDSAIYYEQMNPYARMDKLRMYYRWKGYSYFKLIDYPRSLYFYEKALEINLNHIMDADDLFNDYDDLAYLAKLCNDTIKERKYTEFKNGALHKKTGGSERNLFVFNIENTQNKKDSNFFIDKLLHIENRAFKHKVVRNFERNSVKSLDQQIDLLLQTASKEDVFVFYFDGKTYWNQMSGSKGILIGNDSISSEKIQVIFSFLPVQNSLLILDGDQFHFVEDFIIYKEKNTDPAWEINLHIITNNRGKIRIDSTQNGLLSWSLSEIFNQNKTLSSDMLKTQTETYLAEKGMFWSVKSYAIGYPFLLYNTRMEEKVSNPDNRTRGAAVEYIEENTLAENKEKPSGSYALVFGINEYKYWNSLKNPINDARAIHQILSQKYGFESRLILNATALEMEASIRSVKNLNAERIVVFYAGHGFFEEETQNGFLVLSDSKLSENDPKKTSYYDYYRLVTFLENLKCKNILLVLDACFSGTIEKNGKNLGEGICIEDNSGGNGFSKDMYLNLTDSVFIARHMRCHNMKFITSGGKEYVPDGSGEHSPFASKLIEVLQKDSRVLSYSEIRSGLLRVDPQPRFGRFGTDAASSEFLLVPLKKL